MAIKPTLRNINASSAGVINWAVAEESGYLAGCPLADNTIESIKAVGEFINATQQRQNSFLSSLVNRIALVIISTKAYSNPWSFAKRGRLEAGDSLEEIYVNLAKVEKYKPSNATNAFLADLFGKRKPDVLASYSATNFLEKYPVTVSAEQLSYAFTSMDGVNNLIEYITQSLYSAFEYDEFLVLKFVLYRAILDGKVKAINISALNSEANCKAAIEKIRSLSNNMTFLKQEYNYAKVYQHCPKADQKVIIDADAEAALGVQVLAYAFNKSEAEYGDRILLDGFGTTERDRLDMIFDLDVEHGEHCFTSDEITAIGTIKLVIMDKDWFILYDRLVTMTEQYMPNTLEWNYFLHHQALFSWSPFKNICVLYTGNAGAVSAISVTPSTADAAVGTSLAFTASVTATGFVDQSVVWSVVGADSGKGTKIGQDGILHIGAEETATSGSGTLTVKATSVADATVYGTATVTLVASQA